MENRQIYTQIKKKTIREWFTGSLLFECLEDKDYIKEHAQSLIFGKMADIKSIKTSVLFHNVISPKSDVRFK